MIGIALMVLRFAWPFLLVGGLYLWADHGWCNAACRSAHADAVKAHAEVSSLQAAIDAARQRATDLALLATQRLTEIDAAVKRQKDTDDASFHVLQARANVLPVVASIRLSDGAFRLWRDSAGAANDTGSSPLSAKPAPAIPEPAASEAAAGGGGGDLWYSEQDVIGFTVDAAQAYRSCVAKWRGAVSAYDSVRTLQEAP